VTYTLAEIFDNECLMAMEIGMTYDQYWNDDPEMFIVYAKLFKRQRLSKFTEQDTLAWMIGSYVYSAVSSVAASLFGKQGKYPDKIIFAPQLEEDAAAKAQEKKIKKQEAELLLFIRSTGFQVEEAVS